MGLQFDARLLRGLSKEESDDAKRFLANNFLIDRVRDLLRQELLSLSFDKDDYDNPSWAYKQAHFNGRAEALKSVLKMLGTPED